MQKTFKKNILKDFLDDLKGNDLIIIQKCFNCILEHMQSSKDEVFCFV